MTAIAVGSNGRHYFVQRDSDLSGVFDAEARVLTESVAANATAEVELAPGVTLVQLFDRSFTQSGSKLTVPLGSLAKGETKTVLLKVRFAGGSVGPADLADVNVRFRDLATGRDATETGKLGLALLAESAALPELDGVVLDRVQRSETSAALLDANSLFSLGKTDEARKRLEQARQHLSANKAKAELVVDGEKGAAVDKSFENQQKELTRASDGFAAPPAPSPGRPAPKPADVQRDQKANARENASRSVDFGF